MYLICNCLILFFSLGYEGVFMKRIDEVNDEGEATFYRTSRFTMVTHRGVALRDLAFKVGNTMTMHLFNINLLNGPLVPDV